MTTDVELLPLPRSLDVWFAHKMHVYASANVAHHTAAKDAEIERLRSEVERLAEALRLALKWAEVLPTGEPLRAESVRDLDNARAALDQEVGNG